VNVQLVFYFTRQLQIHKSEYVPIDREKSGWKTDAGGRVINNIYFGTADIHCEEDLSGSFNNSDYLLGGLKVKVLLADRVTIRRSKHLYYPHSYVRGIVVSEFLSWKTD
jgi:hypothetical protein